MSDPRRFYGTGPSGTQSPGTNSQPPNSNQFYQTPNNSNQPPGGSYGNPSNPFVNTQPNYPNPAPQSYGGQYGQTPGQFQSKIFCLIIQLNQLKSIINNYK